MAEPEATTTPPPAPAEPAPKQKLKLGDKRPCPYCSKLVHVGHFTWCEKNPNRRIKGESKPKAKREAAPTEKPARKPRKPRAASREEEFMRGRQEELKGGDEAPKEVAPPPAPKKKRDAASYAIIGLFAVGAGLFLASLFRGARGAPPQDTGEQAAPETKRIDGFIPGEGPVHIPGFSQAQG